MGWRETIRNGHRRRKQDVFIYNNGNIIYPLVKIITFRYFVMEYCDFVKNKKQIVFHFYDNAGKFTAISKSPDKIVK